MSIRFEFVCLPYRVVHGGGRDADGDEEEVGEGQILEKKLYGRTERAPSLLK